MFFNAVHGSQILFQMQCLKGLPARRVEQKVHNTNAWFLVILLHLKITYRSPFLHPNLPRYARTSFFRLMAVRVATRLRPWPRRSVARCREVPERLGWCPPPRGDRAVVRNEVVGSVQEPPTMPFLKGALERAWRNKGSMDSCHIMRPSLTRLEVITHSVGGHC